VKCPKCGLLNPETAQRCDCGYDFEQKAVVISVPKIGSRITDSFESKRTLAICVIVGLLLVMSLRIVAFGSEYLQLRLVSAVAAGQTITQSEGAANDKRQQVIASLQAFAYIVTAILFLVWIHRVYLNLSALGAFNLTYSPGWAVGGFFVPFLNLVRPFQVVKEIWRASDPDEYAWRQARTSPLVGLWWISFLGTALIGRIVAMLGNQAGTTLNSLLNATRAAMFNDAFDAAAAVPAIILVWSINKRQELRHTHLVAGRGMANAGAE